MTNLFNMRSSTN